MAEKFNFEESPEEDNGHAYMPQPDTPRVYKANEGTTSVSKELHAYGRLHGIEHGKIGETRDEITNKYEIPQNHIIVVELPAGTKARRVRAFSVLKHKHDPYKAYYAEGHISHNSLYDRIVEKFPTEVGVKDFSEIDLDLWVTKKGFVDPHHTNFTEFPEARASLFSMLKDNREINGYTEEEFQKLIEKDIPNWFLSGDSEHDLS